MNITVDTTLKFNLPGGRALELDVLELEDFIAELWDKKGKDPEMDAEGKPKLDADGNPLLRTLDWGTIQSEFTKFAKAQGGIDLKKSEAIKIWTLANHRPELRDAEGNIARDKDGRPMLGQTLVEKKRDSLHALAAEPPDSPNSPPSTDPRLADD